jgi:hypothetical protein
MGSQVINFEKLYNAILKEYDEFKEIYINLSKEYLKIENKCKDTEEEMYAKLFNFNFNHYTDDI